MIELILLRSLLLFGHNEEAFIEKPVYVLVQERLSLRDCIDAMYLKCNLGVTCKSFGRS